MEIARGYIKELVLQRGIDSPALLPPETQIAQDLNVARSSVREAVKSLESLGVIEARQGEGLFIRSLNFDSLFELLTFTSQAKPRLLAELVELRNWLEAAAITDVIRKIADADLGRIKKSLDEWRNHLAQNKYLPEDDRQFHLSLYKVLKNETLLHLLSVFWAVFNKIGIAHIQKDPAPWKTWEDHLAIYEAIVNRNSEMARKAILESNRDILKRIQEFNKEEQHE